MSFLDLGPRAFTYKTAEPFLNKFCMLAFRYKEMKIHENETGHITKMVAIPI